MLGSRVIFIRATYPDRPPSVEIVISKSKVTPLATRTIPQLELCGANLLAKLMTTTRQTLGIPMKDIFVYTDSTIVLAWLDGKPRRYCIYSANRIASTVNLLPSNKWKHVPTSQNPADAASRGLTAAELRDSSLWWHEPQWLQEEPVAFPPQPSQGQLQQLQEVEAKPEKAMVMTMTTNKEEVFELSFKSYTKLTRVTSWMSITKRRRKVY